MLYFRTCAYNAEKTIRRAMDSVLSQTIGDFTYYVLENGSTDNTREIIQEYAAKDSRIVAFYNEVNRRLEENPNFWKLPHNLKDEDYLVMLDADDYYEPTFAEEVLNFMYENDLDVAACGSIFEDEEENYISSIIQGRDLILRTPEEYDENFMYAHWNMRQVWGKVYRGSVAKYRYEMNNPDWFPKAYGGDTINVMETLKPAKGFGVLAKALHHYQLSKKSVSYRWLDGREEADKILDDYTKEFLTYKAGSISENNIKFLTVVYLNAVKDTCMLLLKGEFDASKRMELLVKVFGCENFKEAIARDYAEIAELKESLINIRKAFLQWIITKYELFTEEDRRNAYLFLISHGDVVGELISSTIAESIFLHEPGIVSSFLDGKVGTLLQLIQAYIEKKKNSACLTIEDIVFCQNISAYFGMEEMYILYSKQYIEKLIEENYMDKAMIELREWINIRPDDEEFSVLLEKVRK